MRAVILWRVQENGDAVERHAVACERNHAANDFDAFTSFARCRKYLNRMISWSLGWSVAFIEKVALELPERARQVTLIPFNGVQVFKRKAQTIAEVRNRRDIGSRSCCQNYRSRSSKSRGKGAFGLARYRYIQENDGQPNQLMPVRSSDRINGKLKHAGPVGEAGVRQLAFIGL
jgi:hypothetical protein